MSTSLDINVKHLTRVEGHGNIVVNMKDGVLERAELQIVEAPRYFEAMLKGRSFHEAAIITSRICGICSLGHQITSLKTTEAALGLEVSEQTVALRKLCIHGATMQSNLLHAYFLAAPDFLKVGSVFPLVGTHPEVVKRALRGDWAVPQLAVKAAEAIRLRSQAEQASLDSVRALVRAVEAKDPYTRRHSEHVAYYAVSLAQAMGQPETIVESVRVASLLHDIGKIGVPDHILTKRGDLTEAEFAHIRRHPALGAEMLSTITSFRHEATLVRYHHERWDGRGYPDGLRGPASPLGSRIMGVADAIDAMLMPRTYKDAYPLSRVLEELRRCAGTQFDPEIAAIAERWCRANPDRLILPDDARAPVVPAIGAQVRST